MVISENKIKLFILMTLIAQNSCVMSIQKNTALIGTGIVGTAAACGSYYLTKMDENVRPELLGVASVLVTAFTYHQLNKITPQGRLKQANKLLKQLGKHALVSNELPMDKEFFDYIYEVYLTEDLPLISAYNHLISILPVMHSAIDLINKASVQAYEAPLKEECECTLSYARKMFNNISSGITRIRQHKDYLEQLRLYKQYIMEQRQLQLSQQMVIAQTEMASAQSSATFLKWLKAIFGR
jgi:hypothetical protein